MANDCSSRLPSVYCPKEGVSTLTLLSQRVSCYRDVMVNTDSQLIWVFNRLGNEALGISEREFQS